jgi:hypothetical protein
MTRDEVVNRALGVAYVETPLTTAVPPAPSAQPARRGDWFQTRSGLKFFALDPRPEEILIEDIAHALGNICRFLGHTSSFYSVAEHSVLVSKLVPPELALAGLLHDAAEAYLGDLVRPLKHQPEFAAFRVAEQLIEQAVQTRFDVPIVPLPPEVKIADDRALAVEALQLMNAARAWPSWSKWIHQGVPDVKLDCLGPREAGVAFLQRYHELAGQCVGSNLLFARRMGMGKIHVNGQEYDVPDGSRITVRNGKVHANGVELLPQLPLSEGVVQVEVKADTLISLTVPRGDVTVHGNVGGAVDAGGNAAVTGSVNGSIYAGGSITCMDVGGNVDAGGSVACGNVAGMVDAGGSVACCAKNHGRCQT